MPDTAAPRLPRVGPEELDGDRRALYDVFVGGPRQSESSYFPVADSDGVLSGPYRAMLLSPALGAPLERLGRAVRYDAALPPRLRELIILTVAQLTGSQVEWAAHEGLALASGVPEETVQTLREGAPTFLADNDLLVHSFVRRLLVDHEVEDGLFEALRDRLGLPSTFEVVATAGYYQTIAHINNAFGFDAKQRKGSR